MARRARGSRVVILPGRILLRRAPLAERTRTKRRWFPASPQTIRLSADSAALEGGFWSCLKGLSLSRWRSATHPSIPGDLILAASTMALRPLYSMNRSWAAHNGLVGGSSPPGPTTQSCATGDFVTQATIDLRAPCPLSGFPAPESFPARAMPPNDRLRLNNLGRADQARPEPGHP